MSFSRLHWLLSALLLLAGGAAAAGQVVYKWKDSSGNVHFTDTPPPEGATLLKGPKPPPAADPDDGTTLAAPCRPDISAAECEAARRSMQTDAKDPQHRYQQAHGNSKATISDEEANRQAATNRTSGCSMWRDVLASLEDRQNDTNRGRLTATARAALPAQIADAKQRIASSCD